MLVERHGHGRKSSAGKTLSPDLANVIRILTVDAIENAKSGHPGLPMGMAEVAVALFGTALKFDPSDPLWPDRDRFVLSAGHGSMLLYSVLHLTGYPGFDIRALTQFRQFDALAAGHPEMGQAHGIEMTTGPLGQGIASAVGMALAERLLNARFGDDIVDHRTYVICSDGDLMEGISHEACSIAGHLRLSRLIVLYDDNETTIDGPTNLAFSEDTTSRFTSYGWYVETLDGHDMDAVAAALLRARTADRPSLLRCRTVIGKGSPNKEGQAAIHAGDLGPQEVAATRRRLGWTNAPFDVPEQTKTGWERFAEPGRAANHAWKERLAASSPTLRADFEQAIGWLLPETLGDVIDTYKRWALDCGFCEPTRFASGHVVERLVQVIPELVGGSGDLTEANNTRATGASAVHAGNFSGRYIHYGAREHAMAAVMNGLALHGGTIPFAGTFLVFSDYARPSIRLAALMKLRVIHVMTHDSVGLGQDGPTHQPIEHLASLRAMPNLLLLRPADALEVGECWQIALEHHGPSIIALSREPAPLVRKIHERNNLCRYGAYILSEAAGERRATVFATGLEVALAMEAQKRLEALGIGIRVVSMPSMELFEGQDRAYQDDILASSMVMVAVEAASRLGWDRYIGRDGVFIGMDRFGASAPGPELLDRFGITADAIVKAILGRQPAARTH